MRWTYCAFTFGCTRNATVPDLIRPVGIERMEERQLRDGTAYIISQKRCRCQRGSGVSSIFIMGNYSQTFGAGPSVPSQCSEDDIQFKLHQYTPLGSSHVIRIPENGSMQLSRDLMMPRRS